MLKRLRGQLLRLSKRTDYALILLSHLCIEGKAASAQEMAGRYKLPQPMVANILKSLSSADIIESKRGQRGGYILIKPPGEITLFSLVQIIDSPFNFVMCAHEENACEVHECCPTREPLLAFHAKLQQFLESLSLEDIINHPDYNSRPRSPENETSYLS